jgi:hypothetical protein
MTARPARLRALTVAALLVALAAPSVARAAACCMSASAIGVGRLRIWEKFAVGLSLSAETGFGHWDADGDWTRWGDSYSEQVYSGRLWGLVGFGRRTSVWVQAPVLLNHRSTGALSQTGGGFGDLNLGARYEVLSVGEIRELPAIALTAGIVLPTGRATDSATTTLGVDATGRGATALTGGLSLELTRLPLFVRFDTAATVPLPTGLRGDGPRERLGTEVEIALIGGAEVHRGVVLSLRAHAMWARPAHRDGKALARSKAREVGLTLAGSVELTPHWTLQASLAQTLLGNRLGANRTGRLVASLGLRYGGF